MAGDGLVKLDVAQLRRQHNIAQVVLGGFDGEVGLEGLDVVAVVAELAVGLGKELRIACGGEIVGAYSLDQVIDQHIIGGSGCRYLRNGLAPLPEREAVLQHAVIEDVLNGDIEFVVLLITIFLKRRHEGGFSLKHLQLEVFNGLAVSGCAHLSQERLMAAVDYCVAHRAYVGH